MKKSTLVEEDVYCSRETRNNALEKEAAYFSYAIKKIALGREGCGVQYT
jgi:hypothetical protein